MKKIFVSLMAVAALFTLASCEKNFDPKIYGTLTTTNFPATEADYESELMLCYVPFTTKWSSAVSSQQHCFYGGESTVLNIFDVASDYCLPVLHSWGGSWMRLSQCYYIDLEKQRRGYNGGTASHYEALRDVTRFTKIIGDFRDSEVLSDAKKKQFEAEARICRGLMMYYMLHIYGPLPFILDPADVGNEEIEAKLERPSLDEISQWIYDDLKFGVQNAPETQGEKGRYTADYARFMLMKHCLNEGSHMSGWYDEAYNLKSQFTGNYALFTDPGDSGNPYKELFRAKNDFSCEDIMAVSVDKTSEGSDSNGNFNPLFYYIASWSMCATADGNGEPTWCANSGGVMGWSQTMNVDTSFFDTYEPGDLRRDVIVDRCWDLRVGAYIDRSNVGDLWDGYLLNKFPHENAGQTYQDNDIPLARWADVLLLYAEAAARRSNSVPAEAVAAVNEVRARAGLPGLSDDKTASYDAFMDALLAERGHEFLYEGFRKIDLIRFGKYYTTMSALDRTPTSEYWPIPEFSVNQAADSGYTLTQYYTRPDYDGPAK